MIIPKPLKPGDTIGIAAPSGQIRDRDTFSAGINILHQLGYSTKFPRELWPGYDFFSDTDNHRLLEFHKIWFDEEVDAVFAARGGFGCLRIAASLDYDSIAKNPKLFAGFSDISLLHSCIQDKCQLISLHGPVITSLGKMSDDSIEQFRFVLSNDLRQWRFTGTIEILRGGPTVCGVTAGGNLSTIISTLGTPFQPEWRDKIVFLEDTSEYGYRIDKMLTQLKLAGMLDGVKAFILGDFSHGLRLNTNQKLSHHQYIWKRTMELLPDSVVVWADFPLGHGRQNFTVPIGLPVGVDSGKGTISCTL